jgi:Carboxypeptidase regulatory-like domain
LNKKTITFTLLLMLSATLMSAPFSVVGQLGVYIYQVTPTGLSGPVGEHVNVQGTINTRNGAYEVWFSNNLVDSNTAEGFYVNANFTVPEIVAGSYTIVLRDVSENANATKDFSVTTEYSAKAVVPSSPAILQQGSSVTLNVEVTGGEANKVYYANITVMLPAPLNTNYSRQLTLTTNGKGTAQTQLIYPDTGFQPAGSITDYAGSYKVFFNQTQLLSTSSFAIGFTDLDTYHRGQSMTIRAIGYQPNEASTISITYADTGAVIHSEAVSASSEGTINAAWTVPLDTKIGNYNLTITPASSTKPIRDSQLVAVPGYFITIKTLNLAGAIVPQILVRALDEMTNSVYNATSALDGKAALSLEKGNHKITAFWNDVKVGEITVPITGESSFDVKCELTNLKITVRNRDGFLMPFVNIDVSFQYVKTDGGSEKGSFSGQTDLSGTYIQNSTLARIGYTINASLYGQVFNIGNNTVSSLPAQSTSEAIILCPTQIVEIKVVGYNQAAVANSRLELVEITSGIFYGYLTDNLGNVNAEVTFGKYKLRVYAQSILLNESILEVFSDTQKEIQCSMYNIQISVKVADYFGQPIPNAQVIMNRQGTEVASGTTQANGTVTFNNVIGGNIQVIAFPAGKASSYEAVNIQVDAPKSFEIKLTRYMLLGPLLVETSLLVTIALIASALILFLLIETYRRKRQALQNSNKH